MNTPLPILLFIAVAVIIALVAYGAHIHAQRRIAALGAVAARLGWYFDPSEDPAFSVRYSYLSAFAKGDTRRAYNLLRGGLEINGQLWPAVAGDYRYDTSTVNDGKRDTTTHRLSFLIVETPHLGAPDLFIRREGFMDRFATFFGFDDIDFESNAFNERFHVKSSDKRFAYAMLDPRMMEFLLESDPPSIEFRRAQCCFMRGESTWTGDEFLSNARWAQQYLSRWPPKLPSVLES